MGQRISKGIKDLLTEANKLVESFNKKLLDYKKEFQNSITAINKHYNELSNVILAIRDNEIEQLDLKVNEVENTITLIEEQIKKINKELTGIPERDAALLNSFLSKFEEKSNELKTLFDKQSSGTDTKNKDLLDTFNTNLDDYKDKYKNLEEILDVALKTLIDIETKRIADGKKIDELALSDETIKKELQEKDNSFLIQTKRIDDLAEAILDSEKNNNKKFKKILTKLEDITNEIPIIEYYNHKTQHMKI